MTHGGPPSPRRPDERGRRYLITGSTRGLGYFCAERLVAAGAHVIMTGRNPNRLAAAHAAVERRTQAAASDDPEAQPGTVETLLLDTSNLGSVRAAAATARTRGPLHGLLLNAGVVHAPSARREAGGHELVFATNALGHFALAGELLQNLAVVSGRMVWLGSLSTALGAKKPVDVELADDYAPWKAYVQSKIATTVLGFEADRRLRDRGVPAASVVVHPGYALSGRTAGVRGVNEPSRIGRFVDNLQTPISQSKDRAAAVLVHALTAPDVQGGEYWGPQWAVYGAAHRAHPARVTRDPQLGAWMWEYCERTTGTRWPFEKAARARRRLR